MNKSLTCFSLHLAEVELDSMNFPEWLPNLFRVLPWMNGTYDELYVLFRKDFVESQPCYEGVPIWFFPEKENGKEKVFWHLTTRNDKQTGERLPDMRRCERLPWARPMLDHVGYSEELAWDYEEGDGTVKTYVWLEQCDFLVLLKKYRDGRRRLITSYWIEYAHTKRSLRKKYEQRL